MFVLGLVITGPKLYILFFLIQSVKVSFSMGYLGGKYLYNTIIKCGDRSILSLYVLFSVVNWCTIFTTVILLGIS